MIPPRPDLRLRLNPTLILKRRLARTNDLPHDLPRNAQLAADRLDRLPLDKLGAADLRNRLHNQHPNLGSR